MILMRFEECGGMVWVGLGRAACVSSAGPCLAESLQLLRGFSWFKQRQKLEFDIL